MKKNPFLTVMIIPHNEHGPKSLKISVYFVRFLAILLIVSLMLSFMWLYNYTYVARENDTLKIVQSQNKNTILEYSKDYLVLYQDIKELKEKVSTIEELEGQVRIKNGFDPTKSFFSEQNQEALVDNDGKNKYFASTLTINETKENIELMKEGVPEKEKSLNELIRLMEDRNEALLSIPSINPTIGRITSSFGYRRDPFNNRLSFHDGLDIANSYNTPVYATADGIVIFSGYNNGYGNQVVISHGNGYVTYYGHNARNIVSKGDFVRKGQTISYMGSTGRSTGPHVHYTIKKNGKYVNPINYFN